MRVLIIDTNAPDVAQTRAALISAGHFVERVEPSDAKRIRELLEGTWDAVILEWLTTPSTIDILQTVNAKEGDPPACIVCSAKAAGPNVEAAFRAGAEDFLRKPLLIEQLQGRLGRIAAQRESLLAAAVSGDAVGRTATSRIVRLAAWADFSRLATEAVAGVTTVEVELTAAPRPVMPWLGSRMVLSVASAGVECHAVVDGDRESLERFGDAAVGSRGSDAVADLLNEIVNTAGGAFMRSAVEDSVLVTSGLPASVVPADLEGVLSAASHTMVCWLTDRESGAQLRLRLGVLVRRNRFVRVTALREGMVLASDLRGTEGIVLITAGTRLTSSASERVRRMLDGRRMVEVADLAA